MKDDCLSCFLKVNCFFMDSWVKLKSMITVLFLSLLNGWIMIESLLLWLFHAYLIIFLGSGMSLGCRKTDDIMMDGSEKIVFCAKCIFIICSWITVLYTLVVSCNLHTLLKHYVLHTSIIKSTRTCWWSLFPFFLSWPEGGNRYWSFAPVFDFRHMNTISPNAAFTILNLSPIGFQWAWTH